MIASLFRVAFLATLLAAPTLAKTWIVDDNGGAGVDFTDIAPAIAAAAPGDLILVYGGDYGPFVVDKGVVLIGFDFTNVSGPIQVLGVNAPQRAALSHFYAPEFDVIGCTGTVIAQDFGLATATVQASTDVRLAHFTIATAEQLQLVPKFAGLTVDRSRCEIQGSYLRGVTYDQTSFLGAGSDGGDGIDVANAARVHASRCEVHGGNGGGGAHLISAGNGGFGMLVGNGTQAIITGDGSELFESGFGGICAPCTDCLDDGVDEHGLFVDNGTAWTSGTTFPTLTMDEGIHCIPFTFAGVAGNTVVPLSPMQPTLDASGPMTPNSTVTFRIDAPPGTFGTLNLGRTPTILATPPILVEKLTQYLRTMNVTVDATGVAARKVLLPSGLPIGFTLIAQAELTLPDNTIARTNSAPVVVR